MHLHMPIGREVWADVRIGEGCTRADMLRLIAMLTIQMEILEDAPVDAAVTQRLKAARPLLYQEPADER